MVQGKVEGIPTCSALQYCVVRPPLRDKLHARPTKTSANLLSCFTSVFSLTYPSYHLYSFLTDLLVLYMLSFFPQLFCRLFPSPHHVSLVLPSLFRLALYQLVLGDLVLHCLASSVSAGSASLGILLSI